MPVFTAVPFGEHDNVVIVFEAFLENLAKASIQTRILVDGDIAGTVQDPPEYGCFPEARLCHERCRRNGMPNDIDVQKALVVRDDDVAPFLRNIFGTFNRNGNPENFENDVLEHVIANFGAIFPMAPDTAVKRIGNSRDNHDGEDDEVIKKSKNSAHCLFFIEIGEFMDIFNINKSLCV